MATAPGNQNGKKVTEAQKSANEYEYSEADLHDMGECLLKAKEIQADPKLYKMVMQHLNMKVDKIMSLDDLRKKQKEIEMRDNDMAEAYAGEEE